MQAFIRHNAGLNLVEAGSLDSLTEVPDLRSLLNPCVPMHLYAIYDFLMFLLQGSIFFKGPILLLPSVTALVELLLRTSRHVIDVAGTQVMILNYHDSQSLITMLLIRFKVPPCVQSLEDCKYLVSNQRSVGNERVGECTNFFRVISKLCRPTENRSSSDHLLIMCKLLASISAVLGIMYDNQSYQILPQPIAEGLSIYSTKYSYALFHRF